MIKNILQILFGIFILGQFISSAQAEVIVQGGRLRVNHDQPAFSLSVPGNLKEMSSSLRPKGTLYLFAKPTKSFNKPSLTINIKIPHTKKRKKPQEKPTENETQNFGHQDPAPGRSIRTIKLKDRVLAVEESDIMINNTAVVRYTATIPLTKQPLQIVASGAKGKKQKTFDILKKIIDSFESPDLMPEEPKTEDK